MPTLSCKGAGLLFKGGSCGACLFIWSIYQYASVLDCSVHGRGHRIELFRGSIYANLPGIEKILSMYELTIVFGLLHMHCNNMQHALISAVASLEVCFVLNGALLVMKVASTVIEKTGGLAAHRGFAIQRDDFYLFVEKVATIFVVVSVLKAAWIKGIQHQSSYKWLQSDVTTPSTKIQEVAKNVNCTKQKFRNNIPD